MHKLVRVELLYTAALLIAEIVFLIAAKIERPKIYV
jgi:hypothetical protein